MSCHLVSATDYDLLYVCDLGKLNVIQAFDGLVGGGLGDGQMSRKGDVTGIRIGELKLYYAIKANLLFISFSEKLSPGPGRLAGDIRLSRNKAIPGISVWNSNIPGSKMDEDALG